MFTNAQLFSIFNFYEESRFIRVKSSRDYVFICRHFEPASASLKLDASLELEPAPTVETTQFAVRLNQYVTGNHQYGYAGKCDVCGKVYYR